MKTRTTDLPVLDLRCAGLVGDKVKLRPIQFVILKVEKQRVLKVGMKFASSRGNGSESVLNTMEH